MHSVHITTKGVSLNPIYGEMYSLQHYVIKFISDLRQIDGSLRVLRFHPSIKQCWIYHCAEVFLSTGPRWPGVGHIFSILTISSCDLYKTVLGGLGIWVIYNSFEFVADAVYLSDPI